MFNGRINDQGKIVCLIWRTNEPPSSLSPTATIHDEFLLVIWKLLAPLQIRGKRRLCQIQRATKRKRNSNKHKNVFFLKSQKEDTTSSGFKPSKWGGDRFWNRRFSQLWRPRDLDLRWPWILYRSIFHRALSIPLLSMWLRWVSFWPWLWPWMTLNIISFDLSHRSLSTPLLSMWLRWVSLWTEGRSN